MFSFVLIESQVQINNPILSNLDKHLKLIGKAPDWIHECKTMSKMVDGSRVWNKNMYYKIGAFSGCYDESTTFCETFIDDKHPESNTMRSFYDINLQMSSHPYDMNFKCLSDLVRSNYPAGKGQCFVWFRHNREVYYKINGVFYSSEDPAFGDHFVLSDGPRVGIVIPRKNDDDHSTFIKIQGLITSSTGRSKTKCQDESKSIKYLDLFINYETFSDYKIVPGLGISKFTKSGINRYSNSFVEIRSSVLNPSVYSSSMAMFPTRSVSTTLVIQKTQTVLNQRLR